MGMQNDHELTASLLAGGLGGTLERLTRSMMRLMACRRRGARDDPDDFQPDCRGPSCSAAVSQALSDLNDAWPARVARPARFIETERLFLLLKDKTLDALADTPALWSEYHSLAQCIIEMKLDWAQKKPGLRL